jgi:hypothetical protein
MTMINRYLLIACITLSLANIGCADNENGRRASSKLLVNKLKIIRVRNPNSDSTIFLSDFVKEVRIIPLEFNEQCLLGIVKKIVIADSSIFIQDKQNNEGIFRFDMNGKFICRIGKLGRGPSEHQTLTDFSLNNETKSVYIYSNSQRKLLEYSLNNTFIKETLLNFAAENFEYQNNFFYMYRENPQLYESYNLVIKDISGKTVALYFKSEPGKRSHSRRVFSPQQDHLLMYGSLNDTIYLVKGNHLEYAYCIDFGKHTIRKEDRLALKEWSNNVLKIMNDNHYISGIDNLFLLKNLLFFTYVYQNITNRGFYNTKTEKFVSSYSIFDDLSWFAFTNPIAQTEESFISIYDPNSIENNIKSINYQSGKLIPVDKVKAAIDRLSSLKKQDIVRMNPLVLMYKVK